MNLTKRHRLFVEAWDGTNRVAAMRLAGYEGTDEYLKRRADDLLKQPLIQEAIRMRSEYSAKTETAIADRKARQEWWTKLMYNKDEDAHPEVDKKTGVSVPKVNVPYNVRVKASELLGKSEGDFSETLRLEGTLSISELITQAQSIPDDELDAIEAEYYEKTGKVEQVPAPETEDQDSDPADTPKGLEDFL